jgi:hypothetical protein
VYCPMWWKGMRVAKLKIGTTRNSGLRGEARECRASSQGVTRRSPKETNDLV